MQLKEYTIKTNKKATKMKPKWDSELKKISLHLSQEKGIRKLIWILIVVLKKTLQVINPFTCVCEE